MTTIKFETFDDIAAVRLDNGVTNPVSQALVEDLSDAVEKVKKTCRGMVLAGGPKFFSIGLSVPELLTLKAAEMKDFWYRFNRVCLDIYTLPLPTTCALTGHAPAAGAIFAVSCDFRFAANHKKMTGFNEVTLGIPVPYLADMVLRQVVGDRAATALMYKGNLVSFEEAKQVGLVDELLDQEILEEQARKHTAELAAMSHPAFTAIKANRVEEIRLRFEANHKEKHQIFLDCWFSKPVQKLLHEAAEKF
jgi:enoyl-CoA hydratase/carnithine racemase